MHFMPPLHMQVW